MQPINQKLCTHRINTKIFKLLIVLPTVDENTIWLSGNSGSNFSHDLSDVKECRALGDELAEDPVSSFYDWLKNSWLKARIMGQASRTWSESTHLRMIHGE